MNYLKGSCQSNMPNVVVNANHDNSRDGVRSVEIGRVNGAIATDGYITTEYESQKAKLKGKCDMAASKLKAKRLKQGISQQERKRRHQGHKPVEQSNLNHFEEVKKYYSDVFLFQS